MEPGTYRALLIGNSTFPEDSHNLPELKGPVNDLALLRDALTDLTTGLFDPAHVRLLPERTKPQAMAAMEQFFQSAGRQDTLLLYYSGHGQQDTAGNLYVCARNTRTDHLVSPAISDTEINNIMRDSSAQTFVVILDCCHSGAFKGSGAPAGLQGTGRFVITSSRRRELSADSIDETGPSAFTSHLVEALRLGTLDYNGDGYVSLNDVYDYVLTGLRQATGQIPQRHIDKAVGDVTIARAAAALAGGRTAVASPRDRPVLDLSDTDIHLADIHLGEDVPAESVEVFNRSGGELRWTAESSDGWIRIIPERDRFWMHLEPRVGVNRGRVTVRDKGGGGTKVVRVTLRVLPAPPVPPVAVASVPARSHWEPAERVSHPSYPIQPVVPRRRYLGPVVVALALLIVVGVLAWSWLSDLSHAVGAPEPVAELVARLHTYPVRSESVCSDGITPGIVVEVILDGQDHEVPIVTWSGVTDKGKTIYPGTPVLLKVSNGQSCPR